MKPILAVPKGEPIECPECGGRCQSFFIENSYIEECSDCDHYVCE